MLFLVLVVVVCFLAVSNAFHVPMGARKYRLYMSTTAEGEKKLGKVEAIKVRSNYLKDPLQEVCIVPLILILLIHSIFTFFRNCQMKKYLYHLMLLLY
jgi:hypothetical protein